MRKTAYGININPHVPVSHPADPAALDGLTWARLVFKFDAALDADGNNIFGGKLDNAFVFYDKLVTQYAAVGVRVLFVLNQETLWGSAPWWPPEKSTGSGDWARYTADFVALTAQIADHYAGQGVAYELWNEGDIEGHSSIYFPPEHFAHFLEKVTPAIRAADAPAPVVFGGMAAAPMDSIAYVKAVRAALGGSLPVDALGLHPYGKWPPPYTSTPPIPGGWFGDMASHLGLIADAFPDTPCWITEIGLSELEPLPETYWPEAVTYLNGVFDLVQGKFAQRIPVVIWFAWSDEMRNAGIVDADGAPKTRLYDGFFAAVRAPLIVHPLTVTPTVPSLRIRAGAGTNTKVIAGAAAGDALTVLDKPDIALSKLAQESEWLHVRTPEEHDGWTAAWLVKVSGVLLAPGGAAPDAAPIYANAEGGTVIAKLPRGEWVEALDDAAKVLAALGDPDQRLYVRNADGVTGWMSAAFLTVTG